MSEVTKVVRFEAGHRLPSHHGGCASLHGHSYVLEVTLEGTMATQVVPSQGMVVDFSDFKWILKEAVVDRWDHAFFVWGQDHNMLRALEHLEDWQKTVVFDMPPTVEYLALTAFGLIDAKVDYYLGGLRERVLRQVVLHETATSSCRVTYEHYEREFKNG